MKKTIIALISLGLVAGVASSAMADLDFHGDAREVGNSFYNVTDASDNGDDQTQYWYQRVRLWLNANVADGVAVKTRIHVSDGNWDGATQDGGNVTTDYAFMQVNMLGGTYQIGRQVVSWGHGFMVKNSVADRFKAIYKVGDATLLGILQKDDETGNAAGDRDTYLAGYIGGPANFNFGVLGIYAIDHTGPTNGDNESGYQIDAFLTSKSGGTLIAAEFNYKGGDLYESSTEDSPMGGFVLANFGMGDAMSMTVAAAYAANGYVADDDFSPTLLFGTAKKQNAIVNFGGTQATGDDSSYAVLCGVNGKAGEIGWGALVAYAILNDGGGYMGDDMALIEIDGTLSYKLAENTNLTAGIAIGLPDAWSADDDMLYTLGQKIEITW